MTFNFIFAIQLSKKYWPPFVTSRLLNRGEFNRSMPYCKSHITIVQKIFGLFKIKKSLILLIFLILKNSNTYFYHFKCKFNDIFLQYSTWFYYVVAILYGIILQIVQQWCTTQCFIVRLMYLVMWNLIHIKSQPHRLDKNILNRVISRKASYWK